MNADVNYPGFANLSNQIHRKNVKKGFELTIMVVGESGLGKTTLINAMFNTELNPNREIPCVKQLIESTLKIEAHTCELEEHGVKLKITVVDTPGFGDSLNSADCWKPITEYIDEQFEKYLNNESGLNRRHIRDTRIHCCFYFLSPDNYGLKPLDISAMKALQAKVNLVPIIGKSDFLTIDEIDAIKKRTLKELNTHGIKVYSIPDCDPDEDQDYRENILRMKSAFPFAVNSSVEFHEVKGRQVRGRLYPWGIVETENPEHSDFVILRGMLVSNLQDLKDVTKDVHYENYRTERLVTRNMSNLSISDSLRDNISVTSDDRDRALIKKEEEINRLKEMIQKWETNASTIQ